MKSTVFAGNSNSQYNPETILKEVHDFFGQSIRTVDSRSVTSFYTHFKVDYNADNNPTRVSYYRGTKAYRTSLTCVTATGLNSKYFVLHSAPDNQLYIVWYNVDHIGTAPVVPNAKYIEVQLNGSDSAEIVAVATKITIDNLFSQFFKVTRNGSSLEILTVGLGEVNGSFDVNTGFTITGTNGEQETVNDITISYIGTDPVFNGQVLKGYEFNIYSGQFEKNPEINLGSLTVSGRTLSSPTIQNVELVNTGTEYAITFPENTFRVLIRTRTTAKLQLSWEAGQSGSNFITVNPGAVYTESELKLEGTNRTIYIQGNKPNLIVEVLSWE